MSEANQPPARPDRDPAIAPVPGFSEFRSREREADRTTRKPLPWWDRIKFLLMLGILFTAFVWSLIANIPIIPFADAVRQTVQAKWWVLALMAVELVRQVHYFISERSARYHRFWTKSVFGRASARVGR